VAVPVGFLNKLSVTMNCHRYYGHNLLQEICSKTLAKIPVTAFSDVNQLLLLQSPIYKVLGFEYKRFIFHPILFVHKKKFFLFAQ